LSCGAHPASGSPPDAKSPRRGRQRKRRDRESAAVILFLQTTLNGLVLGGIYSLAAVGFSLIFGVTGIVNLTHGIFVVAGAYGAMLLYREVGLDPLLAV